MWHHWLLDRQSLAVDKWSATDVVAERSIGVVMGMDRLESVVEVK